MFSRQVAPLAAGGDSAIPGVSQNAVTGTLYYEPAGFSARASYSFRDKTVDDSLVSSTFTVPNKTGTNEIYPVFDAPYGQLGQIGHDDNRHVGVFFSFQHLTHSVQYTYLQWPSLPFTG
jgi:hypothetical protein